MPIRRNFEDMMGRLNNRRRRAGRNRSPRRTGRWGRRSPSPPRYDEYEWVRQNSRWIRMRSYRRQDINNIVDKEKEDQDDVKPPAPDPKKVLTVKDVNFNVAANSKAHHTDEYDLCEKQNKLVARRGQHFTIRLDFSKPYNPEEDDLRLVFQGGDNPKTSKNTHVEFELSAEDKENEWGAKLVSKEGNSASIVVFTPPKCPVGIWQFKVYVLVKDEPETTTVHSYEHDSPIYMIFNPWCKGDPVFMENEDERYEYVLNETGRIYSGSSTKISFKPWFFGQFEEHVLDVAMYLLDESDPNWEIRADPVLVVRRLSAMVNSSDFEGTNGILTGNWSGDYSGGRSPLSWTGSPAILEKFWETKKAVKFGQCWVFSGVSTTVTRALGIPARSVTNFASAHDTDSSTTIDVHFTCDGSPDKYMNEDSVWNFHVWNEGWMAREDLGKAGKGYGGWQAYDATPQETSEGIFRCGPMPVEAIRQGEINIPFDGPFIFSEVNADRVYWMPDRITGKMNAVYIDEKAVGKFISTKAVNSDEREDVTLLYKPKEDSAAERAAVLNANLLNVNRRDVYSFKKEKDVEFSVVQDSENTWIGSPFQLTLSAKNISNKKRVVEGRIEVESMYYTGAGGDKLGEKKFSDLVLEPGEEKEVHMTITPEQYDGKLKDFCHLDVNVYAHVNETSQSFITKKDFRLRKPHLTIKAPKDGSKDKEIKVEVSFVNPLDCNLTKCSLQVDGLAKCLVFPQGNVAAKGTFTTTVPITPARKGQKQLIIVFSSKELDDINGQHSIFVRDF